MAVNRQMRILTALTADEHRPTTSRLCEVAAAITGLTGAGIMLMSGDFPRGSVCSSDIVSADVEELQYTLGEGPCVDAYTLDRPVLVADLAEEGGRWPAFGPRAVEAGAMAVFGFPLDVGAVRLGALNLYRDRIGGMTDDQHADALVMAGVAARAVLSGQADAAPGALAAGLMTAGDLHLVVHQASGMVSVQLGMSVGTALVRLRAWAFANDCALADVARAVVERRLRFDRRDGEGRWSA